MELTFNPTLIQKVALDVVRPNSWNPKEKNTSEYQHVLASIQKYGQDMPILVREKDGLEILDGEQRYTALKELGAAEIWVYNKGAVTDEEAKAVTIWWQVQAPFDQIKLAPLVVELADLQILLPYSEDQLAEFRELANFNFDNYNKDFEHEEDGLKTIVFKLTEEQHKIVIQALNKDESLTEAEVLVIMSKDYLSKLER